ncbi:MAG: SET domain-containing protein-lysine N-methyltransferase [Chitinophagaceae bacterium]|nr:MAG: SET domain-containing protein-lysine N-methyltransferase [Chitinophagaceae bacterium]
MLKEYLTVAATASKGRGVFTSEAIEADTIIEISPVIVMSAKDRIELDKTLLHDYIFEWGPEKTGCCMALGLVPMYNHSYQSNADYFMDFEEAMMVIKTVRNIAAGEEITINYNGDWNDEKKLWFDAE